MNFKTCVLFYLHLFNNKTGTNVPQFAESLPLTSGLIIICRRGPLCSVLFIPSSKDEVSAALIK